MTPTLSGAIREPPTRMTLPRGQSVGLGEVVVWGPEPAVRVPVADDLADGLCEANFIVDVMRIACYADRILARSRASSGDVLVDGSQERRPCARASSSRLRAASVPQLRPFGPQRESDPGA